MGLSGSGPTLQEEIAVSEAEEGVMDEGVRRPGKGKGAFAGFLDLLGSFGLCILLLFCLCVLTILGTWFQKDIGLYEAKKRYFESWFLWASVGGVSLPIFPGGVTSMGLLAINLLVGGLIRLRVSSRNLGVVIIHLGILFLLISGLVKMTRSQEGHLTLFEGERGDTYQSYQLWEVALWEVPGDGSQNATAGAGDVTEYLIEDHHLTDLTAGRTRTFTSPELPFELVLSDFVPHCEPLPKGPMWEAAGPVVDGYGLRELPPELEAEFNVAGLHAEVRAGGEAQNGILWGRERLPWTVTVGDEIWAVSLRHTRYKMPFTIHLDDFQMERYPGTGIPKSFQSWVTKLEGDESERVLIQMNEPLRQDGMVLFQTNWGPQSPGPHPRMYSVLTVVDNPSDKWPEYSMWVITFGMLLAFGRKLRAFLRRQAKQRAALESAA